MGWFEEQILERRQHDEEMVEDALFEMASAVLGIHNTENLNDRRIVSKNVIDDILKYYRFKPSVLPEKIETLEDQLEYSLRPHGLMSRKVTLSGKWYRETYGPLIVFRKEDGEPAALLPGKLRGYYWNSENGRKVKVNKKTIKQFRTDALCFYRPLPQRRIGIPGLMAFMKNCLQMNDLIVLAGLTLLVTMTGLMLPRMTRVLTGFVLERANMPILWSTAVFLFFILAASQLFSISRQLAMNRIQIKTGLSAEAAMMMRLMSLPASFFKQYSSGELASRCGGVNELCNLLLGGVVSLGMTALASLLYVNQIFLYTPDLAILSLVVIAATVAAAVITLFIQTKVTKTQMEYSAKESGISYSLINSVQKIRLAGAEKRAFARWARVYAESAKLEYNPPVFLKLNTVITQAVLLAGTIGIYFTAMKYGNITPSEYMTFSAAYGALTGAFTAFTDLAVSSARIRPILEMVEPILGAEPETAEDRSIVTEVSGRITLSGVSFRYNNSMPYVIDNMSLTVRAGEYVGIVGTTGCGKSTLMRLLLGFETPEIGAVYYDDRDLRSLDMHSLRRHIGTVTQDGSLFLGDIFSNIIVSAPDLTLNEAWEAAEMAGIAEDIRAMPMGMHTIIGEGQGGLSGGQKQRLMIARAIVAKPKILLFDEATSALDNKTQKQVSDSLDALHCTRIVIAHRLSTIRNCDRILVMDKGRIVEEGTYEELISRNGLFTELVERQRADV